MNRNYIFVGACVAAAAAYFFLQTKPTEVVASSSDVSPELMVSVQVPAIEGDALIGKRAFESACAACHGANAAGTQGVAPPLIHKIYEPSHHADEAFQRAAALGVRSHHWGFGDMPPVKGLTRGDVAMIVTYVRTLQRANGIN